MGFDLDPASASDVWVAKYDPDFNEIGSSVFDGASLFDFGSDVVVGRGGDLYVAGSITVVGQQDQVWAGRYTPDATERWWRQEYADSVDLELSEVATRTVQLAQRVHARGRRPPVFHREQCSIAIPWADCDLRGLLE
ncbi:MAG: hypothetical protein AB1Z98_39890 [Nannocystaceae bacterium]